MTDDFSPYLKMDGGLPTPEGWEDIPSSKLQEFGGSSIPSSKIDYNDTVDLGLSTVTGIKSDVLQVKSVATSGAPYKRIADAIGDVADNSSTKPYTINIGAGIFTVTDIALKGYVNLRGSGVDVTTVKATSLTTALLNIATGHNSSVIDIMDMTLGTIPSAGYFIDCLSSGVTLRFFNCKFLVADSALGYLWKARNSALSKSFRFYNCILSTGGTSRFILNDGGGLNTALNDNYLMQDCDLSGFRMAGSIEGSSSFRAIRCSQSEDIASNINSLALYSTASLFIEGGEYGNGSGYGLSINVGASATARLRGVKAFHNAYGVYNTIYSSGTLTIINCDIGGGNSALYVDGGVTNILFSSFAKHASGTGTDIYNNGGTINRTFCKYATSTGVITAVNEDVDKLDGLHASDFVAASAISGTIGKMAKFTGANAVGDGTNTDADVADAVTKKHPTGGDTALGVLGTKNPPVDADLMVLRDSASSWALFTATCLQFWTYLKVKADLLYETTGAIAAHLIAYDHTKIHDRSHALDGTSDHTIGGLTNTYLVKSDGTKLAPATNTDTEVNSAVSLKHTNGMDQGLDTGGANAVTAAQAKTAYDHSQDNSQAHSDYAINNGDDAIAGAYTLTKAATQFIGLYGANAGGGLSFFTASQAGWTCNAVWTGSVWNRINTGAAAYYLEFVSGVLQIASVGAGANPIVWNTAYKVLTEDKYDANSILAANSDDTPVVVTIAEQTLVGRITGGNITALTTTQIRTLLAISNVENTAHSTDAHTMTIDGRDVSVDGSKLDGIESGAQVTNDVNIATAINGTAETTPLDADEFPFWKAAGTALKKVLFSTLKTTLATAFKSGGSNAIKLDEVAAPTDVTTLDATTSVHGLSPKAVAPASGNLMVLGIGNGETIRADKLLLDSTLPENETLTSTASAGISMKAARVDHRHSMPGYPSHTSLSDIGSMTHAQIDTLLAYMLPTGGTITTSGGKRIHTFTSSGDFVNNGWAKSVSYLVIAGGGGGGGSLTGGYGGSGGGGAGGMLTGSTTVAVGTFAVVVGAGGAGGTAVDGTNGSNSSALSQTAIGGGGGGSSNADANRDGVAGGSGGGGAAKSAPPSAGGAGTGGQGNNGGPCIENDGGGGGGGAGAVGGTPASGYGGNGGAGSASSISGTSVTYAGGGGGGCYTTTAGHYGVGANGGGNGAIRPNNGSNGTANTGGGGGGGGGSNASNTTGGTGGSGIVIISYDYI